MRRFTAMGGVLVLLFLVEASLAATTRPSTGPSTRPKHPADAVQFNGHWYKVFEADLSWKEKKKKCEEMGGYLACIETADEQKFITKLANGKYLSLGGTDEPDGKTWRWVNGSPWKYTCWMDGQPNNYGGVEFYLATYDGGEWVDVALEGTDFWMPTGYICEWEE